MANAIKGQVAFSSGGVDYIMEMSPNAFCELEDITGTDTMSFVKKMEAGLKGDKLAFKDLRVLFWVALLEHHDGVTLKDAGRLMKSHGLAGSAELVMRAVQSSFPEIPDEPDQEAQAAGN
jgi:hypothetical protein